VINQTPTKLGRPRKTVELSEADSQKLKLIANRHKSSQREALRARIILCNAEGMTQKQIADHLGTNKDTVSKWIGRFLQSGMDGLVDSPRPGAPRSIGAEKVEEVIIRTLETKPKNATHWSCRTMAEATGTSAKSVHRIWSALNLQPHRQDCFKLSNDPFFVEKVRDVVGLYMNPPENALVLCMDEKSQIQALERTQPILPLRPGSPETVTHDYYRHGTTTLFAALNVQSGELFGQCMPAHTRREFLRFLRQIEKKVPEQLEVHLILDNYATHNTAEVKRWFARHPRFKCHFTPTYASWLNQVERWFALLTERALRRNAFTSVKELIQCIEKSVEGHNENLKPFIWTASADMISEKVASFLSRNLRQGTLAAFLREASARGLAFK
jgi:transposase